MDHRQLELLLSHLSSVERARVLRAIESTVAEIGKELIGCKPSVYLYGSIVLGDLRPGLSDVDLLVLTQKPIDAAQAESLVGLRQRLTESDPINPWYRRLEGGMLSLAAFRTNAADRVVYWGTSGQRIAERHRFDTFSMVELLENGILLLGGDVRSAFPAPTYAALLADVRAHYEAICTHAQKTGRSVYSFGWLADIARGLYTIETGKVASKTAAMQWALEKGICPVADKLAAALIVRKNPRTFDESIILGDMAEALGPDVQAFAKVLGKALETR